MSKQTITINGVLYDAHTGMRLGDGVATQRAASLAPDVHRKLQHSRTLNRSVVSTQSSKTKRPVHQVMRPPVARSPHISKFSPKPQSAPIAHPHIVSDIGPMPRPQSVKQKSQPAAPTAVAPSAPKPAHDIKNQAIESALRNAKPKSTKKHKLSFRKRHPRLLSIVSASLAIVLLAGYLSYINMPNLSVRLAAAQAGIAASYPSYHPNGYDLSGPVAYANGQVSMKFASNAGPQNFTLRQTKSNWDSSAVLDNYVNPQSDGDYTTYNDSGLTIYTYGTNAAWVNGGILYTVSGNAELSNDQVRRLATSM